MPKETEIKLRITDVAAFRRGLQQLGARAAFAKTGRVHERNAVFDTPGGRLKRRGQLLRIRTETLPAGKRPDAGSAGRVLVTFKRPARSLQRGRARRSSCRHKVREEIELRVSDAGAMTKILESLGMRRVFEYEKFRTTFELPRSERWARGLLIELDETPMGTFAELEGPPQAIDRAAKLLGFTQQEYVLTNYLVLYREWCRRRREKPAAMIFNERAAHPEHRGAKKSRATPLFS